MEKWRAIPAAHRYRILSTTGGISEDERRVINSAPKCTMEEYEAAQFAAAGVLREVVKPENSTLPEERGCDARRCSKHVYSEVALCEFCCLPMVDHLVFGGAR